MYRLIVLVLISLHSSLCFSVGLQKNIDNFLTPQYRGECKSKNSEVMLNEILFVSNRVVKRPKNDGFQLISLKRDYLIIEEFNNDDKKQSRKIHIAKYLEGLGREYHDLDIELEFVWVSELAIYWKETFKNKPYKHGILKLNSDNVSSHCMGYGGMSTSH